MRATLLLVGASLLVFSQAARAQCGPGLNCTTLPKPSIRLDFGASPKKQAPAAPESAPRATVVPRAQPRTVDPADCRMVKPPDPTFTSNMRMAAPNPNVDLPMKIVEVPACKKD